MYMILAKTTGFTANAAKLNGLDPRTLSSTYLGCVEHCDLGRFGDGGRKCFIRKKVVLEILQTSYEGCLFTVNQWFPNFL